MSEHDELADAAERDVEGMQHDSERVGRHGDEARAKLDALAGDGLIPQALGPEDPAWREPQPTDDESADADIGFEHGAERGDEEDPEYSGGDAQRGAASD